MRRTLNTVVWVLLWAMLGNLATAQDTRLELVVQTGHATNITDMVLSGDGRRVLTGSHDRTAILWDAETGRKLQTFTGHADGVRSVALSGDGQRVLTGSWDRTAILWDAAKGSKLQTFAGHTSSVTGVAFSSAGKWVLTGSEDKTAILWDAETGRKLQTFAGHADGVRSVALSADGKRVLTGSYDKTAILWDADKGTQLQTFTGHTKWVWRVTLSADGKRVLTGSADETVILWDADKGTKIHTFAGQTGALSGDGKRVLTGSSDRTATLWDADKGTKLRSFDGVTDGIGVVALSGDGQRVLTGAEDQTVILWDAAKGNKLQTFAGLTAGVRSVAMTGEGKRLLVGSEDRTATLWDAAKGARLHTLSGHTYFLNSVALSADGQRALSGAMDKTAILWDAERGIQLQIFHGDSLPFTSVALRADGKRAVGAVLSPLLGPLQPGFVEPPALLWDAEKGARLQSFAGHTATVAGVALSGNGKRVLTGSWDKTAILWDADTGTKIQSFTGHTKEVSSVALSADGKRVLTGSNDKTAVLWDAETGTRLQTFTGHTATVEGVALSADSKWALTGSDDTTVISWDAETGRKLQTFTGHTDRVTSVALTGDGKRALTGAKDGTVRLWDARTGKELCTLISIDGGKDWLVVTPDGYFDGSENAARFVSYRIAGTLNFVPLDRYRKQFERPGLLAMIWKGEDYRGNSSVVRDLPPSVRITSPAQHESEIKEGKLTITAEAESRGQYPVTQFRLKVDGKPHVKRQGLFEVANPQKGKTSATWEIELEPGRHTIEVLAYTQAVFAVSEAVEVKFLGGGAPKIELPTLYVLAVGISKYPQQGDALDFAHRDAEEITKAFQTHSGVLFKRVEARVVTDEKATRQEILKGLGWLRRSATQKDFAVFFYAGHGVKDQRDKFYLFPVDGDRDQLVATAVDGNVIQDELVSIPGQLLVILDACHSGNVGGNKNRGLTENLLKDLSSEEKGVAIMCSAAGRELAQESREHRHGMFTLALLEGLRGVGNGAQGDSLLKPRLADGAVYFKELDSYVTQRVKQLSKGYQHPVTSVPRNFRDFPITKP
jgi:WD40 repeat protein